MQSLESFTATFKKGQRIAVAHREGGSHLFFVEAGRAKVLYRHGPEWQCLHILKKGDVFSLVNPEFRILSMTESTIRFYRTMEIEADLREVIKLYEYQIQRYELRIQGLQHNSVKMRTAEVLLLFAEECPEPNQGKVYLSRVLLADLAATTRETLSRFLREFEDEGFINRTASEIRLLDIEGLRRFASQAN